MGTWAAPAPAAEVDGCRATWLGGVSETTFSKDLCTLSGYWKAKFASESAAITTSNTITYATASSGYESLLNAVSSVVFGGGGAAGADITTTHTLGYANDLVGSTLVNPLGHTGLSYCMCLAIEAGCDPKGSGAAIPASPIKTAAFEVTAAPAFVLANYISATGIFVAGAPALDAEYTALESRPLQQLALPDSRQLSIVRER